MKIYFVIVLTASIVLSLIEIARSSSNKDKLVIYIRNLSIACVVAELGMLFVGLSLSEEMAYISYGVYYISYDWLVYFLTFFICRYLDRDFCGLKAGLHVYLVLSVLDSINLYANSIFRHMFTIESTVWTDGLSYYMAVQKPAFNIHLGLDYLALVLGSLMLIQNIIKSVGFYKIKSGVIIAVILALVVLNGGYLLLKIPLDWSIILYSIAAITFYYFAELYVPRTLVTKALRQTIDNLNEGLILFDVNDKCLYINRMASSLFTLNEETCTPKNEPVCEWLDGKALRDITDEEPRTYVLNENFRYKLQIHQITSFKEEYLGSYILIDDVTREWRAMKSLEAAKEEAERAREEASKASKAKGDFLASMSHEIRTPINAILGMNEMILREDISPEIQEFAKNIQISGDALLSIINDILDFSKIEAGKFELLPTLYEPLKLVRSCELMIMPRITSKKLDFKINFDENTPKLLRGDEARIRQIMINLLTNAAKYTETGSVTLDIKWIPVTKEVGSLKFAVIDTGVGITPENQAKLFTAFQRVDEVRNRNIEGTGLGLTITSRLIGMMNGSIKVESEYGKGSTFTAEIPQMICLPESGGAYNYSVNKEKAKYTELFRAPSAHVMVVDDYKMNLTVIKGLLKKTEVQLTLVQSGAAALEEASKQHFDIILMDHMMPEMDGIETFKKLKSMDTPNKETPVVMLTANAVSGVEDMYLKEGFNGYLTKPINSSALEKTLLKYIPDELIEH